MTLSLSVDIRSDAYSAISDYGNWSCRACQEKSNCEQVNLKKSSSESNRLTAVEELAGMDILCSDKTGTLTKNELTVADPIPYEDHTVDVKLISSSLKYE